MRKIFYEPGVILREIHEDDPGGFSYWTPEGHGWRVIWSTHPANIGVWVEEAVVRDVIADWELCYYLPGTPADNVRHSDTGSWE